MGESATLEGASWADYSKTGTFTLSTGDVAKTVYLQAKDKWGNESAIISAAIILDSTNPIVASVVPANNAVNVDFDPLSASLTSIDIQTTFAEAVDASTVLLANMTVVDDFGETPADTSIEVSDTVVKRTFAKLKPWTTYTVTIATQLKDKAGLALQTSYSWSFTTKSGWASLENNISTTGAPNGELAAAANDSAIIGYNVDGGDASNSGFDVWAILSEKGVWGTVQKISGTKTSKNVGSSPRAVHAAINASGKAVVAWDANGKGMAVYSNNDGTAKVTADYFDGTSFGSPAQIDGNNAPSGSNYLGLQVAASNAFMVVWQDSTQILGNYFNGTAWSTAAALQTSLTFLSGGGPTTPTIAIGPTGKAAHY